MNDPGWAAALIIAGLVAGPALALLVTIWTDRT